MPRAFWSASALADLFDAGLGHPHHRLRAQARCRRLIDAVVAAGGVAPGKAAMFDDIARNLVAAHALGMTTVWLKTDAPWGTPGPGISGCVAPGDIDHETDDLAQFLNSIRI